MTLRTLGRYLTVLYYLAGAAFIGQLIVRHDASPRSSLDTGGRTKFPTESQGVTSRGRAPSGNWKIQANFTVTDTFPGPSYHRNFEDSGETSSPQQAGTDKPAQPALGRGKIQVQVTALCPKNRFSRELCLNVLPEVEVAFGPGLENIEKFLYTAYPRRGTTDKQSLKYHFTASVPKIKKIVVNIRHFSAEEKARMIGYVAQNDFADYALMSLDLDYITERPRDLLRFQVHGLVQHELVHIFQHFRPRPDNERPPKGLVEGIADFVTLKAGVLDDSRKASRPLTSKMRGSRWDDGYAETAYFLEWLEDVRIGKGAIGKLNDALLRFGYYSESAEVPDETGDRFWKRLYGSSVDELWEEYGVWLDGSRPWGICRIVSVLQWLNPSIIPAIDRRASGWGVSFNFLLVTMILSVAMPMLVRATVELVLVFHASRNAHRDRHNKHKDEGDVDQGAHEQPKELEQPGNPAPPREEPARPRWFGWKFPSLFRSSRPRRKLTIFDVDGTEWEVKTIVESRTFYGKLQYRVRWAGENEDDTTWYYAQTFKHGPELLQVFHDKNPHAPGPSVQMEDWLEAARTSATVEDHPYDNKPVSKRAGNISDEAKTSRSSAKARSNRTRSRRQKSRW